MPMHTSRERGEDKQGPGENRRFAPGLACAKIVPMALAELKS